MPKKPRGPWGAAAFISPRSDLGEISARLAADRLEGPNGNLTADVRLERAPRRIAADITLDTTSMPERAVDPVGAGDALLAYATLAMVAAANEVTAAILGSFAAVIKCERDGNVPVGQQDVLGKLDKVERQVRYG